MSGKPAEPSADLSAGRKQAPRRLVLVRHAESMGNVADRVARQAGSELLDLETRDADTPLSPVGDEQAAAVGRWMASLPDDQRPDVVLCSPYVRAASTARAATAGLEVRTTTDERLRERDLGWFDGMTGVGIRARYPEEAARRSKVGKFYYRPPGGESWTDVVLRVRSLLTDIRAEYDDGCVWVFSHQAVIMAFRYLLENMDEKTVLEIDSSTPMANCAVTTYVRSDEGALTLERYGDTSAVDASAAPTTHEPAHAGAQPNA